MHIIRFINTIGIYASKYNAYVQIFLKYSKTLERIVCTFHAANLNLYIEKQNIFEVKTGKRNG